MSVVGQFIRNTVYQSFNDILLRLIAAISGVVIIRYLSKEDYGILAIIMAVVGFVNWLSNLGYPTMIMKSISQNYATDLPKAASYYRFTLKIYGAISTVFAVALFFAAPLIAEAYRLPQTANLYRVASLWFFLTSLFSFYNWTFVGLNKFKQFFLKVCFPKESLTLLLVVVFLYAGLGVKGVIFAQMLGIVLALLIAVGVVSPVLRGSAEIDRRWIVKGALEVTPANLAYASTVYMDVLVIGVILTTELLASYRACLAIVTIAFGLLPIGTFVMPTFHQLSRERARLLLEDLLKITVMLSLPLMFFVASFSKDIILVLFGSKYADSAAILTLFSFVLLGQFLESVFVGTMTYLERFKAMSLIWALMAAVNVALLIVLTKLFGLIGAVCATMVLRYSLSILMGIDVNGHGMEIRPRKMLEIFAIGAPLFLNFIGMYYLNLPWKIFLYAATLAAYVSLLKLRNVFAGFESFKELRANRSS